jgi:hypothetical protein
MYAIQDKRTSMWWTGECWVIDRAGAVTCQQRKQVQEELDRVKLACNTDISVNGGKREPVIVEL